MMGEKDKSTVEEQSTPTEDYLRAEVAKLNAELREMASENAMLKETIVRMAMKQNDVK